MSTSTKTRRGVGDRLGALSGAAYVLLILIGNQVAAGNQQDPHPSGAADLADFAAAAHPTATRALGETMEILGLLVLPFFLGWLAHRFAERGAGWLGTVAALAGGITLAVKIASFMPMGAGILNANELDPTTARVLSDMNSEAFVVTFLTFGVFLAAAGLGILASGLLGRVAGWFGVVIGVLCVGLTVLTRVDPLNTNPMPFLAGLLWLLVVSVRLGVWGPRRATAPVATSAPAYAA
jgi:hypothetical protein